MSSFVALFGHALSNGPCPPAGEWRTFDLGAPGPLITQSDLLLCAGLLSGRKQYGLEWHIGRVVSELAAVRLHEGSNKLVRFEATTLVDVIDQRRAIDLAT